MNILQRKFYGLFTIKDRKKTKLDDAGKPVKTKEADFRRAMRYLTHGANPTMTLGQKVELEDLVESQDEQESRKMYQEARKMYEEQTNEEEIHEDDGFTI